EDFRTACKPKGHIVLPPTALVAIENTHNLGGGVVFPQQDAVEICAAARAAGVASYLDGARLFNASIASGTSLAELARPFDLVFHLAPELPDAATIVARAKEAGVLVSALGPRTVRAVTHRDVSAASCRRGADLLAAVIERR